MAGDGSGSGAVVEVSAGGVVVCHGPGTGDGPPHAAIIARVNRAGRIEWCLPKGHLEPGETLEIAAVREVHEETGIQGRVTGTLGAIDYWFFADGHRVHKTVHLFLMAAEGGTIGVGGDPDEEAVDAAWVPLTELVDRLTFPNERRMARAAVDHYLT